MDKETKSLVAKARRGTVDLAGALEEVRRSITMAQAERHNIENAPVSKTEALQRVDGWADGLGLEQPIAELARRFARPIYRAPIAADTSHILVGVLTDQIRQAMAVAVEAIYGEDEGLSAESRQVRRAELDEKLLSLELAEEAIIRAAEASGLDFLRRPHADPRAVLAQGEFLP